MAIKCIIIDDEPIARGIVKEHLSKIDGFELVMECKRPTEALPFLNSHTVDLLFLDINLPEINGVDFARSMVHPPAIIFTTAYREFAPEAFDLQSVDYLVKPISFDRFLKAINRFVQIKQPIAGLNEMGGTEGLKEDFILLKDSKKTHKIYLREIRYIESDGDYLKFFLLNKKVMIRGSIRSWENQLPESEFIRIHNSFIVALSSISSISACAVELDGVELPISRSRKDSVMKALNLKT